MHRILQAAVVITLIAGCSPPPVDSGSAKRVPPDRVYTYQTETPSGPTLIVSRDNRFWVSGGCFATLLIDGRRAARLDTGEVAKFHVKPGRHIVGIGGDEDGSGLCAMQIGQPVKETPTEVVAGETQKYRISGTQNSTDIRPSAL